MTAKNLLNTVLLGSAMTLSLQASAENAITETTGATIAADQQQMTLSIFRKVILSMFQKMPMCGSDHVPKENAALSVPSM